MQQVNLYLAEFQPRRDPLLARQIAVIVGVVFGVFVLLTALGAWNNDRAETHSIVLQGRLSELETQVAALRAKQPKSQQTRLDKKIAQLEKQIERRQRIEKLIADQNLGNSAGFSRQLEAMARQQLDSLSIEQFGLMQGGSYVEFSGWARKPDQVPFYIQQLRAEPSFERVGFGVLTIEKSEKRRDALEFSVTSPKKGDIKKGDVKEDAS